MDPISSNNLPGMAGALGVGLLQASLLLAVLFPLLYGFYFLMTMPWRRRERAIVLLDILELGRQDGRSPGETLASLGHVHDRQLPARLHLLSAHLESGLSLDAALEEVPSLLPPAVRGLLQTGLRHGEPAKVYSVCRRALIAPLGRTQSAVIYLTLILILAGATTIPAVASFRILVLPKLRQVFLDIAQSTSASADDQWFNHALDASVLVYGATLAGAILVSLAVFQHITGPRLPRLRLLSDHLRLLIPWHRDRIHRDFAAMLALLLDSSVPEAIAVAEAARATGSTVLTARAERVVRLLSQGEPLPTAIRQLDSAGEFRWRLENARHGSLGKAGARFTNTLRGWLDALDARANQRETNAVQVILCTLVLSFGLAVGLNCAGLLGWLIAILETTA